MRIPSVQADRGINRGGIVKVAKFLKGRVILGLMGLNLISANVLGEQAGEFIVLRSIVRDGNDVHVTYLKNFPTCLHMLAAGDQSKTVVHIQNIFCETGSLTTSNNQANEFTMPIGRGGVFQLCHGNNKNFCSDPVAVTEYFRAVSAPPR